MNTETQDEVVDSAAAPTTEVLAPTLREELEKSFDSAAKPADDGGTKVVESSAKPLATPPVGQKPGDDPGQDVKDVAALQAAADANRPIPERLKAKWGDKWEKLDPATRAQFHDYESDIGRVTSKYGKDAKAWNDTLRVFAPYEQMVRAEGGTVHTAMGNLLETARILRQGTPEQKVHMVQQMLHAYGINLPGAGNAAPAGESTQAASSGLSPELLNRINQLERGLLTREAEETHNTRQQVNSAVETFLADSANVYLQEPGYLDTMQALIRSGKADDLKSAYDQAAWLHDRPREMEIAKRNLTRTSAAAGAAVRAKSAAVSMNGSSPGLAVRDLSKLSLRDELAAHLDGDS